MGFECSEDNQPCKEYIPNGDSEYKVRWYDYQPNAMEFAPEHWKFSNGEDYYLILEFAVGGQLNTGNFTEAIHTRWRNPFSGCLPGIKYGFKVEENKIKVFDSVMCSNPNNIQLYHKGYYVKSMIYEFPLDIEKEEVEVKVNACTKETAIEKNECVPKTSSKDQARLKIKRRQKPCSPQPHACAVQGKNCGFAYDSCGNKYACGSCQSHETCNVAQKCECSPQKNICQLQGRNCGTTKDRCGHQYACGSCTHPWACNTGNGQCSCSSQPGICNNRCGIIRDQCGKDVNCQGCAAHSYCDGGSKHCVRRKCPRKVERGDCSGMMCNVKTYIWDETLAGEYRTSSCTGIACSHNNRRLFCNNNGQWQ